MDEQQKKLALQKMIADSQSEMEARMKGRFRDSGRVAENPGEYLDAVVGVPVRTGIRELQKGNFNLDTLKKVAGSIGTDPRNAPTGFEIAEATGVENPYVGAALATSVDFGGQVPGAGQLAKAGVLPGVVGRVANVASKEAAAAPAAFQGVKKMFRVGNIDFPAANAAEALKVKAALEASGKVGPNRALQALDD